MTVQFREFGLDDLDAVAAMADDIWFRNEYGPKNSFPMSYLYVYDCLRKQTSTVVAEENGRVVGIVSVRDHTKRSSKPIKKKDVKLYARDFLVTDESESLIQLYTMFNRQNDKMVKDCGLRGKDEILLLMVDITMRGRGLGKELFRKAMEQFSGKKGRRGYVLTDSACNYIFYDKVGCELVEHATMDFGGTPLKTMLYSFKY